VFSFLKILPRIQDTVALLLLYTRVNVIQHIVVYNLHRAVLSTFFFALKGNITAIDFAISENGYQSQFQGSLVVLQMSGQ